MAGTTVVARSDGMAGGTQRAVRIEHNKMVDDLETLRAALSSGGVVAVTELIADHATFKANADATETLVEELHADHATFKTVVDEIITDYTALRVDVTAIRAVLGGLISGSVVWDPASLIDGAGETSPAITATGAALGDFVLASAPYDLQGITATAYVSAANTVRVRLQNETAGTIDLASGTWLVRVIPTASFAAPAAMTATAIAASTPATLAASGAIPSAPATLSATAPSGTAVDSAADLLAAKVADQDGVTTA